MLRIFSTYKLGTVMAVVLYVWLWLTHRMPHEPLYWQHSLAFICGGLVVRAGLEFKKESLK
jgi:hypothetical protein